MSSGSVFGAAFLALTAYGVADAGQRSKPPEGFKQILPRGRIAAITNPTYVPADEAAIPAETPVLGVVIDGEARAYSLNLLNVHEVVNDEIGGTKFAAVW